MNSALPLLEQRLLLTHVTGLSREQWITREPSLSAEQQEQYENLAAQRVAGVPMAYLLREREFYGRSFYVSPAVLIPRPETELLVDFVLQHAAPGACVLDVGTGSGAIAVSIAAERPDLQVVAVDLNDDALAVAERNNIRLAQGRVHLLCSDWFSALSEQEPFDVIVSNPPYIAATDAHLQQGDLRYEPVQALTDGVDGLQCLRHLIQHASRYLRVPGWLALEHGYDQAATVRALLQAAGWQAVQSQRDLAQIERISYGRK
jgi:release factor glutamine methyltransferase